MVSLCQHILDNGLPFIAGGDFQMNPSMVESTGIFAAAGGFIVSVPDHSGTCKGDASFSNIDFLLLTNVSVRPLYLLMLTCLLARVPTGLWLYHCDSWPLPPSGL